MTSLHDNDVTVNNHTYLFIDVIDSWMHTLLAIRPNVVASTRRAALGVNRALVSQQTTKPIPPGLSGLVIWVTGSKTKLNYIAWIHQL